MGGMSMAHYIGNLVTSERTPVKLRSVTFASNDGREDAVSRLVASARQAMESERITCATLLMTENGCGIGGRELENRGSSHGLYERKAPRPQS